MILEGSLVSCLEIICPKWAWLHPAHLESFLALPPARVVGHVDEIVVWDFAGQFATTRGFKLSNPSDLAFGYLILPLTSPRWTYDRVLRWAEKSQFKPRWPCESAKWSCLELLQKPSLLLPFIFLRQTSNCQKENIKIPEHILIQTTKRLYNMFKDRHKSKSQVSITTLLYIPTNRQPWCLTRSLQRNFGCSPKESTIFHGVSSVWKDVDVWK